MAYVYNYFGVAVMYSDGYFCEQKCVCVGSFLGRIQLCMMTLFFTIIWLPMG